MDGGAISPGAPGLPPVAMMMFTLVLPDLVRPPEARSERPPFAYFPSFSDRSITGRCVPGLS
jgi:hypothetical protein